MHSVRTAGHRPHDHRPNGRELHPGVGLHAGGHQPVLVAHELDRRMRLLLAASVLSCVAAPAVTLAGGMPASASTRAALPASCAGLVSLAQETVGQRTPLRTTRRTTVPLAVLERLQPVRHAGFVSRTGGGCPGELVPTDVYYR